jgi:mono/diheme cytochrome c family protein
MRQPRTALALALAVAAAGCAKSPVTAAEAAESPAPAATASPVEAELLARGEYLVRLGGCNDCHTPGYAERGGEVDKSQWLTGTPLGYRGPWGTTYAANLRLLVDGMDEAQWLEYSGKLRTRPIMPDFNLRAMTVDDRRALYRFVRSLGPAGTPAPAYLPPGRQPPLPYFELVLPAAAGAPAKRG